ncbi:MAG: hypothetical protein WBW88_14035, partial [Rhodothermales bacterium]
MKSPKWRTVRVRRIIEANLLLIPTAPVMSRYHTTLLLYFCLVCTGTTVGQSDFRIAPYVQNPDFTSMSVIWFSNSSTPGIVTVSDQSGVVA